MQHALKIKKSEIYPDFDKSTYFSPDGTLGCDFGLNYDYISGQEKNYTFGANRIEGNVAQYEEIRKMIESLPEMKRKYELRAFCCVPSDQFGTSISFAIANHRTHKLRAASPFCVMYYGCPEFYAKNPRDLVAALVAYNGKNASIGNQSSFGNYILRKDKRQR